ncbi:YgjP-like metallopeptidase domain-containing protein [Billgrantia antri]|uniref:YgjP-like metallopeptidase domain-containing protein n=1 Tax=Billgrantia antri TaxID=2846777 RepID=UPI003B21800E
MKVQDLDYHRGSCGKGNRVNFHCKTLLLPRHISELMVVHELSHLHEPYDSPRLLAPPRAGHVEL